MIIDSHCHLDFPILFDNLDDVIKKAENNNVKNFLTICTTLDSFVKIKLILKKYKNVYGTFGIHPHETNKFTNVNNEFIINIKRENKKVIGIGETGLDFYYNHSDKNVQIKSFVNHIHAAAELNIPIIVHTRNAEKETYEILKKEKKNLNLKTLIHCFSGSKDFVKKLLDLDCYISISGIVTFKNTLELEEAVDFMPLNKLLVETDSPYLTPSPYRGKSNEPAYIVHTIDKISKIKRTSEKNIIENTTKNFVELFNLNEF